MAIQQGKGKKRKAYSQPKWKEKAHIGESSGGLMGKLNFDAPNVDDSKEVVRFHFGYKGNQKRNCPKYLQEVREAKGNVSSFTYGMYSIEINNTNISNSWILDTRCGFTICTDM